DAIDVYASGLEPGAIATLTVAGEAYRAMVPQDATAFIFRVAALHAGETSTLVQERCGLKSDAATTHPIATGGAWIDPDVELRLFGCARAVRVVSRPGTWLQMWGNSGACRGGLSAIESSAPGRIAFTSRRICWQGRKCGWSFCAVGQKSGSG